LSVEKTEQNNSKAYKYRANQWDCMINMRENTENHFPLINLRKQIHVKQPTLMKTKNSYAEKQNDYPSLPVPPSTEWVGFPSSSAPLRVPVYQLQLLALITATTALRQTSS